MDNGVEMLRVGVISTVGVPACYGGYETLVENLLTYQQNKQIQYQIYCSSVAYSHKMKTYKGATLKYVPFKANGPTGILYDTISILHAYSTCDVIMSLGTVGCFILPLLKLFSSKKIIVNLDGLDDRRDKWNRLARFVIGKARNIAARKANIVIADNSVIKEYIQTTYHRDAVLIEYGGDNAQIIYDKSALDKYGFRKGGYAFKVARIEPENKIDVILEAFSRMPSQQLVVVGNWNNSEYGKAIREKFESFNNLILLDPIYESQTINLLRSSCRLYIHGHSVGGTNPSLVEAMYSQLPIIATDVSYNRATTEDKALYFKDANDLCGIVLTLNEQKRIEVASNMYEIATRRYLWKIIVDKYEQLY
jgi:glycosyltransferase involved in cell wall biosynthesis